MAQRKAASKRLRFAVFARDGFSCRYCGQQSDAVPLVVDHMIPVVAGGTNDIENLITACEPCNQGKAATTLSQHAPNESDRLARMQEQHEQLRVARAARAIAQSRAEMDRLVGEYWCDARGTDEYDIKTVRVMCGFARQHGVEAVFGWIDQAVNRLPSYKDDREVGMYISGIRRTMLADGRLVAEDLL